MNPASCRWCHRVEPNNFLLQNNHWGASLGLREGHCIAQDLTRNHVAYHVARLTLGAVRPCDTCDGKPLRYVEKKGGWFFANGDPVTRSTSRHVDYNARVPLTRAGREAEREQLALDIERASKLWSHMPDIDWLDAAREVLATTAPLPAPEHHRVRTADLDEAMF